MSTQKIVGKRYARAFIRTEDDRYFRWCLDSRQLGEIGDWAWVSRRLPLPKIHGEVYELYQIRIGTHKWREYTWKKTWLGDVRHFMIEVRKPSKEELKKYGVF